MHTIVQPLGSFIVAFETTLDSKLDINLRIFMCSLDFEMLLAKNKCFCDLNEATQLRNFGINSHSFISFIPKFLLNSIRVLSAN